MPSTQTTTEKINRMEETLQLKLKSSKNYFAALYQQWQPYFHALQSFFQSCWQNQEFRYAVYLFALLSAIPTALCLLFIGVVIFTTTVFVSLTWTGFVLSSIALGLTMLVPVLITFALIASSFLVIYQLYQYLFVNYQQQKLD